MRGVEKLPEGFVKIEPNIQRRLKAVEKSNSDLKMTIKKKNDDYLTRSLVISRTLQHTSSRGASADHCVY